MKRDSTREGRLHLGYCVLVALGAASLFYWPALRVTRGDWPAPLDDVYIHFDFARAAAKGHPFEWIAGQGYSSGETSPLYALVLAVGYLVGFRGSFLGVWAAIVAVVSVVSAMRSVRTLVGPRASWLTAPMLVCVGMLDWSLFSGMEVALFMALLAHTFVLASQQRQWALGAMGALLVWTRPEAAVIVAPLAVVMARSVGSRSPWAALLRASVPGALATLAVLGLNWMMTGDPQSAGARLKLLSSNPSWTDVDRARELVLNLFYFTWKLAQNLRLAWLLPALAASSLLSRKTRDLGAAAIAASVLYALLVSWNGAARYQNFRYYAPAIELLLLGAAMGMARWKWIGAAAGLVATLGAASRLGPQVSFFRDASANIHDQQVEAGRRLRAITPPDAIVLVGDAGAIPYFSERGAIDALGLGGYHREPFIDASPFGEAATVEILQRLDPRLRPTHMALYPNWFGAITSHFGKEIDHVTIANNVICGGPTKVLYEADFSALDGDRPPEGRIEDEVDIADVVSEREHHYVSPAPLGGWTTLDVRRGVFDAARIIPEGQRERFVVASPAHATLVLRTDTTDASASVEVDGRSVALVAQPGDGWIELRAELPVGSGAVAILATRGTLRDYHVWIVGR